MKAKVQAPPNVDPVEAEEAKDPTGSDPVRARSRAVFDWWKVRRRPGLLPRERFGPNPGTNRGSRFCERTVTGDAPSVTQPVKAGILQEGLR